MPRYCPNEKLNYSGINSGAGGEKSVPTSSITVERTLNIPSLSGKSASERYNLESFPKLTGFSSGIIGFVEDSVNLTRSGEILNEVTLHAPMDLRRLPPPSWSNVDGVGPEDSGEQLIVASSILPKEVQSTGTSPSLVAGIAFESHTACLESPMGITCHSPTSVGIMCNKSSDEALAETDALPCSASADLGGIFTSYKR